MTETKTSLAIPSGTLVGHDAQRQRLRMLIAKNKIPSSLLFSGPAAIGKRLVALELAAILLCEKRSACGECKSCKLLRAGNHPDVIIVDAAADEGSQIEHLREILATLSRRSFAGGSRLVILEHADQLSRQSANLLLKSLEEPRPNNHFILIAENAHALPDTVLSRSQLWFFDKLTPENLRTILESKPELVPETLGIEQAIALLDGSFASRESLSEGADEAKDLAAELKKIAAGDLLCGVALAQRLAKDKERLPARLELLRLLAERQMRAATTITSQSQWSCLTLNAMEAARLIQNRNLNASYLLAATFERLARPAQFTQLLSSDTLLSELSL